MHVGCKYLFALCCSLGLNFHFRLTDCPPKLSHSPSELSEVTCSHDSIYIAGLYSVKFGSKEKNHIITLTATFIYTVKYILIVIIVIIMIIHYYSAKTKKKNIPKRYSTIKIERYRKVHTS